MSKADHDFEDCYTAEYRAVVGLLVSLGSDRARAEELAQDSFVAAYLRWRTLRRYDNPGAWVRLVAVRRLRSSLRIESRRKEIRDEIGSDLTTGASDMDPEARLDLARALERLPVHHQQVVLLFYVADMSLSQISKVLGISTGTVQSRLHRARATLAQLSTIEETYHV